jgi:uncharacterized protein YydD (DUF2326 family)
MKAAEHDQKPDNQPTPNADSGSNRVPADNEEPRSKRLPENMIRRISSSDPRFRTVDLEPGMNVVLADKTTTSTDKDSRNGAGKTLLTDIIHFLFGGNRQGKGLKSKELDDHVFSVDLRLGGKEFSVHRAVTARVMEIEGDFSDWPIQPHLNKKTGSRELKSTEWCEVLGHFMFSLTDGGLGSEDEVSFRSLFPYLVRRVQDLAFSDPFLSRGKMKEGQKQMCNAFLLGLNVEHAAHYENLREKNKHLRSVKKALETGILREVTGSIGKLESEITVLEEEVSSGARSIESFAVVDEYSRIEVEATTLTHEIHEHENEIYRYRTLVEFYRQSQAEERDPGRTEVAKVYAEVGVVFPDLVKKRLDDVEAFHKQLVINRRQFLQQEIDRLNREIDDISRAVKERDLRRAQLMSILNKGGALQEYNALQEEHTRHVARLEQLKSDLGKMKQLEQGKNAYKIEEATLNQTARRDLEERQDIRKRAQTAFERHSRELYGEAGGRLIIDLKDGSGYAFDTEMPRSGAGGIEAMKVFCYDLTLAQMWSERKPSPGVLVHDSALFDPCDARQVAGALRLAAKQSEAHGYQYVCMLNSDRMPYEELGDFDIAQYVRLTLTDQEDGCLLGFRLKEEA